MSLREDVVARIATPEDAPAPPQIRRAADPAGSGIGRNRQPGGSP